MLSYNSFGKLTMEKSMIYKISPDSMKTGDGFFVISNIRDNTEFDRGEVELRLLQSITQAISEAKDFHSALKIVLQKVCETTGWVFGETWMPSSDGTRLECSPVWYSSSEGLKKFRINSEKFTFPPGVGLPGRVWSSKRPAWIEDVTKDTNFPRAAIAMEAGIRAGVAIPIMAEKEVVAVMDFFTFEPKTEDERFIKLISSIAAQIGLVIQRRKAEDALEAKADQLTVLIGAICYFLESGDWRGASSMILYSALCQTDSEYGFIGVVVKGPALRILAYQGINWDKEKNVELYQNVMCSFQDQGYIDFPSLDNLFGRVITERKVIISDDPGKDPRSGGRLPPGHPPLLSFLGVPIFKGLDLIGMIGVANRKGGYTGEEQSRIEILCHVTSILYDNYLRHQKEAAQEEEWKKQEETIRHLAYYDMLTNLPNRLSLHDDIDRAISQARTENRSFALLVINLDRFEEINNTLGHDNGDLILQQIAIRLQGISGEPNRVARLGGDIFAALLQRTDAEGAAMKAEEIIGAIKEPLSIADLSIEVSASIGIALFPGHGEDADTLSRRAEIAMYAAKRTESSLCIYSPKYDQYSQKRLALMGELRQAIEQDQLFLLYQPKIGFKTGKTLGVEALCRWQHPKSGIIPPNDFIYLAERGGLIKELTLWVIKEVMRQSRIWCKDNIEIQVAANLSAKNLRAPKLLDQIKGSLSTWGVPSRLIRFEITESTIMGEPEQALEFITQLNSMGVCFSIDDFGTGYSSLSYLQRLPVDEIKIDKSFVMKMMTDENSMKIVNSIIELGHSLGLKVTAEGVEDKETLDRLTSLGCDTAQGYFISRPIPASELKAWLGKQTQGQPCMSV